MKLIRLTMMLLSLILLLSCDKPSENKQVDSKPAKIDQEATNSNSSEFSISSQASQKQIILAQIIGPELRKAVVDLFGGKDNVVRNIGFVCRRDELYIFAVDFYTDKHGGMDEPLMYVIGSVLMGKNGNAAWRVSMFALNTHDFIEKYNHFTCGEPKSNKDDEQ